MTSFYNLSTRHLRLKVAFEIWVAEKASKGFSCYYKKNIAYSSVKSATVYSKSTNKIPHYRRHISTSLACRPELKKQKEV
jgi:hypothetical protein